MPVGISDGTSALVISAESSATLIWDKPLFQDRLRSVVNEKVTTLANEILKARGQ